MKPSKVEQKATLALALLRRFARPSMQALHALAGPIHQRLRLGMQMLLMPQAYTVQYWYTLSRIQYSPLQIGH